MNFILVEESDTSERKAEARLYSEEFVFYSWPNIKSLEDLSKRQI